uniref:Uncharacterized protein n=1 Tax=Setaria italica TaxID=4555 RepID=A0A0Q3U1N2_SETIT
MMESKKVTKRRHRGDT